MKIEKKIENLNIKLPPCPEPAAIYVPAILSGEYIFISGQTPKDGKDLVYTGKLGSDLTIEEGYEASKICILRCISAVQSVVGDLDRIDQIVKLTGYVNCSQDFTEHSLIINGASELLEEIFGEKGKHTRDRKSVV